MVDVKSGFPAKRSSRLFNIKRMKLRFLLACAFDLDLAEHYFFNYLFCYVDNSYHAAVIMERIEMMGRTYFSSSQLIVRPGLCANDLTATVPQKY